MDAFFDKYFDEEMGFFDKKLVDMTLEEIAEALSKLIELRLVVSNKDNITLKYLDEADLIKVMDIKDNEILISFTDKISDLSVCLMINEQLLNMNNITINVVPPQNHTINYLTGPFKVDVTEFDASDNLDTLNESQSFGNVDDELLNITPIGNNYELEIPGAPVKANLREKLEMANNELDLSYHKKFDNLDEEIGTDEESEVYPFAPTNDSFDKPCDDEVKTLTSKVEELLSMTNNLQMLVRHNTTPNEFSLEEINFNTIPAKSFDESISENSFEPNDCSTARKRERSPSEGVYCSVKRKLFDDSHDGLSEVLRSKVKKLKLESTKTFSDIKSLPDTQLDYKVTCEDYFSEDEEDNAKKVLLTEESYFTSMGYPDICRDVRVVSVVGLPTFEYTYGELRIADKITDDGKTIKDIVGCEFAWASKQWFNTKLPQMMVGIIEESDHEELMISCDKNAPTLLELCNKQSFGEKVEHEYCDELYFNADILNSMESIESFHDWTTQMRTFKTDLFVTNNKNQLVDTLTTVLSVTLCQENMYCFYFDTDPQTTKEYINDYSTGKKAQTLESILRRYSFSKHKFFISLNKKIEEPDARVLLKAADITFNKVDDTLTNNTKHSVEALSDIINDKEFSLQLRTLLSRLCKTDYSLEDQQKILALVFSITVDDYSTIPKYTRKYLLYQFLDNYIKMIMRYFKSNSIQIKTTLDKLLRFKRTTNTTNILTSKFEVCSPTELMSFALNNLVCDHAIKQIILDW